MMQCRRYRCAVYPDFSLLKTVFTTSRNDKTIVNDGNIAIITFKHNFPLTFSDLLPKLQAINWCT